jgi:hypothetical protein
MNTGPLSRTLSRLAPPTDAAAVVYAGVYTYWWWYNH